jgi:hypothetical protein
VIPRDPDFTPPPPLREEPHPIHSAPTVVLDLDNIIQVRPGSLIALSVPSPLTPEETHHVSHVVDEVARRVGHDQFAIVVIGPGQRLEELGDDVMRQAGWVRV